MRLPEVRPQLLPRRPAWVRDWIGRPYRNGARGPVEFDCYGIYAFARRDQFGLYTPLYAHDFCVDPNDSQAVDRNFRRFLVRDWLPIDEAQLEPGDLVTFEKGRRVIHCGLIVARSPHQMLHIHAGIDAVCVPVDDPPWGQRQRAYWRPKPGEGRDV